MSQRKSQRSPDQDAGQLLRTTRQARGLTQARLAERVGLSQQRLSQIEQGSVDPRMSELRRLFGGLGHRLRVEAWPKVAAEDPDLMLDATEEERLLSVSDYCYLLGKLGDLPHLAGGRLAAFGHGLPVRVQRLDLLVANPDRQRLAEALGNFSKVRWCERRQDFCDYQAPDRPGPMRWKISGRWELRVSMVDALPSATTVHIGHNRLRVPTLPWLQAYDADVADLVRRVPISAHPVPAHPVPAHPLAGHPAASPGGD